MNLGSWEKDERLIYKKCFLSNWATLRYLGDQPGSENQPPVRNAEQISSTQS